MVAIPIRMGIPLKNPGLLKTQPIENQTFKKQNVKEQTLKPNLSQTTGKLLNKG